MQRRKIMSVFGTRPEAIKMAPVVLALAQDERFESIVTVTGQHREMLDQVLDLFGIEPNHDLNLMQARQTLPELSARVLTHLSPILVTEKPDLLLVQGDTTTAMMAGLAAFYQKIPVGHIEAGLRTDQIYDPFPEEMNRRVLSQLTTLHFAPTQRSLDQLAQEGFSADTLWCTGNTVIDALLSVVNRPLADDPLADLPLDGKRVILVTAHRRENWGEPMQQICLAIADLLDAFEDVAVVFAVHRNPIVRETVWPILSGRDRAHLLEPLDYLPFCKAMHRSTIILTDSGGVQEEGPALGKPVLVMRQTTERPEAVEAGTAKLVGVEREAIFREAHTLLTDPQAYRAMSQAVNPYGDGHATPRIVDAIAWQLGVSDRKPQPFIYRPEGENA